jgi:hypothetical protein
MFSFCCFENGKISLKKGISQVLSKEHAKVRVSRTTFDSNGANGVDNVVIRVSFGGLRPPYGGIMMWLIVIIRKIITIMQLYFYNIIQLYVCSKNIWIIRYAVVVIEFLFLQAC